MSNDTRKLVAVIEAGGTKCTVILANKERIVARTIAGAGNYTTLGLNKTLERLKSAVEAAISELPEDIRPQGSCSLPLQTPLFAALTVGMAGLDRESDVEALAPPLAELFDLDPDDHLKFIVGNDATLLSVPMIADHNGLGGVAVVSGTGSVGFSFTKTPSGLPVFHQRGGGYGHLLGDEGSGYHIGKMAIVSALAAFDRQQPFTAFHHAVYKHFQCDDNPQLLLQRVYEEKSSVFPDTSAATRIASVCKAVFDTAYANGHQDEDAEKIIQEAAGSIAILVQSLVNEVICPEQCTLVLGGSLYRDSHFEGTVIRSLASLGISFKSVTALEDAGAAAALILAKEVL